jgi:streptogramin lyase
MTGFAGVRRLIVIALASGAMLAAAAPALAAPQVNGVFTVTGLGIDNQITQGPDGNMWVTIEDDGTNDVARINSQTGQVTKFNLDDVTNPVGITRLGNNLWVTAINQVARFAPGSTDATATMIAAIGGPAHITVGPDGNLWTVSGNNVIKIPPGDPSSPTVFGALITAGKQIVSGGDGNLWATGATQVVSFTTAGTQPPHSPHTFSGNTQGIAKGPGTQIGFGCPQCSPQSVGRITPPGAAQLTNTGTVDPAFGITFANDGGYWYSEFNQNRLARLTPQGVITHPLPKFPTAGTRGPRQITKGPNNTLWVTLDEPGVAPNDKVGRVTGVAPPTPPPPDNCDTFELGKPDKNKRKGTADLTATVPCPGTAELAKTKKVKGDEETAEAEGDVELLVKAKGKAKRRLNKKGKAKVKAEVTYTPDGGDPSTESKKVKLKKRR